MATIQFYNHTKKLFANGEVNLANLKVMLRDGSTVFNGTHVDITELAGSEVSGNGWTAGGEAIANAAITVTNTDDAKLDGDDISVTASGGSITASNAVIIYNDGVDDILLFFIDFEGQESAGDGTPFNINWNANGIAQWADAA